MIFWQQGHLGVFLQIDEEHNVRFMQGNLLLMIIRLLSENTFVKHSLMLSLLFSSNLLSYEDHDKVLIVIMGYRFLP